MKLSELHKSIRAFKFCQLTETIVAACERLLVKAAVMASRAGLISGFGLAHFRKIAFLLQLLHDASCGGQNFLLNKLP